MQSTSWLYVLRLKDDHYYVGTTKDLSSRFEDHWSGKAAAWTKKYPPIEVVLLVKDQNKFNEDIKVKELMHQYGISKVRGGSYSQCTLLKEQEEFIIREIRHANNQCLNCGSNEHWVKNCTFGILVNNNCCIKCGRNTHDASKCYAKTHLNGKTLESFNYNDYTIKELKILFDERQIDYSKCNLKADYVALAEKRC